MDNEQNVSDFENIDVDFDEEEADDIDISYKELISEASGKNESGLPKTNIGLFFQIVNEDAERVDTIREITAMGPILEISKNRQNVCVEMSFPTENDVNLAMMNDLLTLAYSSEYSVEDDGSKFPMVSLVLIPEKYAGKYSMFGQDPIMWGLFYKKPREQTVVLRLVFDEENFAFIQNEDETVAAMAAERKSAQEAEEKKYERIAQKEQERKRKFSRTGKE